MQIVGLIMGLVTDVNSDKSYKVKLNFSKNVVIFMTMYSFHFKMEP